jgi:hypothetical protein
MQIFSVINTMMKLPEHLFLTGVPGSRWSGIAQDIATIPGVNTSDHSSKREYNHSGYTGHSGAYFGKGMEFSIDLDYINEPWSTAGGMKIVKSHEWAYHLPAIRKYFPQCWIMMVYRPDMSSYAWWHEAGGFNIKYPSYAAYKDSTTMLGEIIKQNKAILDYGQLNDVSWSHYSTKWLQQTFDCECQAKSQPGDILVSIIKPS